MHTNEPKEDPLVELGYEHRDVNIKAIRNAAMGYFTFTTVCFIVGAFLFWKWDPQFSTEFQNAKLNLRIPAPPNPLLQSDVTAKTDIMQLRQHEDAVLTSTGWDEAHSNLHIPIDRAMDLILQHGLPVTTETVPAISKGNTTDQRKDAVPAQQPPLAETNRAGTPATAGAKSTNGLASPASSKPLDQQ